MRVSAIIMFFCFVLAIAGVIYLRQPATKSLSQPSTRIVTEPALQKVKSPQTGMSTVPPTDATTENVSGTGVQLDPGAWWDDTRDDSRKQADLGDPWRKILSQTEEDIRDSHSLEALIEKFGDIPEVHTYIEGDLRTGQEIEETIRYVEAMNYLFPNPTTQKTLEILRAVASGDETKIQQYVDIEPPDPEIQQLHTTIKPFFERNSPAEGLRQLRAADPDLAAKVIRILRHEAREDPTISAEEIEHAIRLSYEPPPEDK